MFSIPRSIALADITQLRSLANEGIRMRSLLEQWHHLAESDKEFPPDAETTIGWLMYHTVSIYLHNAFAVNSRWSELKITTPVLHPSIIKRHIDAIIVNTTYALSSTNLCPTVFILPLHVVGSSKTLSHQRVQILDLLGKIKQRFGCAQMAIWNLTDTWARDDSFDYDESVYPVMKHHRYSLLGHLKSELPNARIAIRSL